jgi:signal peptidase II
MIWFLYLTLIIALDQLTKFLIVNNISFFSTHAIISKFLYVTRVENRGVAFSLLQNKRIIFIPVTIALLLVFAYIFKKNNDVFLKITLLFITGGAIGNLIDRIFRGYVVDFFEFHFGSNTSPIFNIADMFILGGSGLLIYYLIFKSGKKTT